MRWARSTLGIGNSTPEVNGNSMITGLTSIPDGGCKPLIKDLPPEEQKRHKYEMYKKWLAANPDYLKVISKRKKEFHGKHRELLINRGRKIYDRDKGVLREKRIKDSYEVKKQCVEHLGGKCIKCGYDNVFALTFHHRNVDEKSFEVSKMLANQWTFERLKSELDKCDVLCANCHILAHSIKWLFFTNETCDRAL